MPWARRDATKFTKKANSPKKQAQWRSVANDMLRRGHSDGAAVKAANSAIKHGGKRRRR
jgi:uncharacterized protein YdaT